MAQDDTWRATVARRMVYCAPWREALRSISYVDSNERIYHDNLQLMDADDENLDEDWDGPYYVGPVMVLAAQFYLAQEWARWVYECTPDRDCLYLVVWNEQTGETDGRPSLTTTDRLLTERTAKLDPAVFASEFLLKKQQLLADDTLATSVPQQQKTSTQCLKLTWEAIYRKRCFECLVPLLPTVDEHYAEFLKTHEGGGKEVAVPLSFWNYRARRFLGLPTH
jgi:hypothetical protein